MSMLPSTVAQVYMFPTVYSIAAVARSVTERSQKIQEAVAIHHAQLAITQRALDENARELRNADMLFRAFMATVSAPEMIQPGHNAFVAGLGYYVDPKGTLPEPGAPARVYPGQFLAIAFGFFMASAQDIGTQLGRILTCPVEAHADEVSYLVRVWPAISNTALVLGHFAGLSRVFREYLRYTTSQYQQLARLEGQVSRENRSTRPSGRVGLEALVNVIRPFITSHVQATEVIWEFDGTPEDFPFRLAIVHRADSSIPLPTRQDVVREIMGRQDANASVYSQGGHREGFTIMGAGTEAAMVQV
ncbi:hypothetical protein AURDEDRAFT_177471 [Auricularia subglabra TFB-10046 SS5]|uniref:Uncharacterized protein n=1 Tax=Auricularia subglabra (strain TFB-10046 / SS5) TaxID=717982 RepID=J0LAM2_AURST|nr:hypothetical protein AURDEDRAFT_177471 [Auricularia subglabra TFB-10046 SS5]